MTTTALLPSASKTALPGVVPLVPTPTAGEAAGLFNGLLAGLMTDGTVPPAQPGQVQTTGLAASPALPMAEPVPAASDGAAGGALPGGLVARAAMPELVPGEAEAMAAGGTAPVMAPAPATVPTPVPLARGAVAAKLTADKPLPAPAVPTDTAAMVPVEGVGMSAVPVEATDRPHQDVPELAEAEAVSAGADQDVVVAEAVVTPPQPNQAQAAPVVAPPLVPSPAPKARMPEDEAVARPSGDGETAAAEVKQTPTVPMAELAAQPTPVAGTAQPPAAVKAESQSGKPTVVAPQPAKPPVGTQADAREPAPGTKSPPPTGVSDVRTAVATDLVQADPEARDVAAGDELAVAASPDTATSDPVVVEAAPATPATPTAAPTRPATAQAQAAKPHGAKPGGATDAAAVPTGDGMALQATATEAGEESGAAQRAARIEEKRQAGEKNGVAEDAAANLAGASANPAPSAQAAAKPAAPQAVQGSLTATAVAAAGAGAEPSLDNAGDQPDSRSLAEPTTDPTLRPAVSGEAPRAGTTEFAQQLAAARQGRGGPNPPALNQVAVHVQRAVQEGNDRLSIQLRPTDLGRIDVQIEFAGDGRMKAKIMAENPYTLDLLQKDSRALERALQDVGLRPEAGGLSFSLRDQGQQAQREDQGQRDRGFGMRVGADARADEVQAPPAYTPIIAPGRVDVRI